MTEIRHVKLITGEEIIGTKGTNEDEFHFPLALAYSDNNNGTTSVDLFMWSVSGKFTSVQIKPHAIIADIETAPELLRYYDYKVKGYLRTIEDHPTAGHSDEAIATPTHQTPRFANGDFLVQ